MAKPLKKLLLHNGVAKLISLALACAVWYLINLHLESEDSFFSESVINLLDP